MKTIFQVFVFCLALVLLLPVANAAEVITPDNLQLVGGYRFPRRVLGGNDSQSSAMGFPRGGCEVQTLGGVTTAWADNGEKERQVLSFESTGPIGASADPAKWPYLVGTHWWTMGQLFPSTLPDSAGVDGFMIPSGLGYDRTTNHVYVAARSRYNTRKDHPNWITRIEWPAGKIDHSFRPNYLAQGGNLAGKFSGGVGMIPEWFAVKYTGGRRLALMCGGLSGGQHGGAGPALALCDDQAITPIFSFAETDEIGRDAAAQPPWSMGTKKRVERGPPNYGPVKIGWAHAPDATGGYFATAAIRGKGAWVDTEQFSSLMYLARRPAGLIDYADQVECLCLQRQTWLYVYDPADIAKAAKGEIKPYEIRAKFYHWPAGLPGVPRSLAWDEEAQLLWVYCEQAVQGNNTSNRDPIIAAYRIVDDGGEPVEPEPPIDPEDPPAPEPEPDPVAERTAEFQTLLDDGESLPVGEFVVNHLWLPYPYPVRGMGEYATTLIASKNIQPGEPLFKSRDYDERMAMPLADAPKWHYQGAEHYQVSDLTIDGGGHASGIFAFGTLDLDRVTIANCDSPLKSHRGHRVADQKDWQHRADRVVTHIGHLSLRDCNRGPHIGNYPDGVIDYLDAANCGEYGLQLDGSGWQVGQAHVYGQCTVAGIVNNGVDNMFGVYQPETTDGPALINNGFATVDVLRVYEACRKSGDAYCVLNAPIHIKSTTKCRLSGTRPVAFFKLGPKAAGTRITGTVGIEGSKSELADSTILDASECGERLTIDLGSWCANAPGVTVMKLPKRLTASNVRLVVAGLKEGKVFDVPEGFSATRPIQVDYQAVSVGLPQAHEMNDEDFDCRKY